MAWNMDDKIINRAYVLYANDVYKDTLEGCVQSIKRVSNIPIIVYMLNSDVKIEGATSINWKCDVPEILHQEAYINREDYRIYRLLIERPAIVRDALNYADTVCYIDSDCVATPYLDSVFDMYPKDENIPYFTEGVYDYLFINGRGGCDRNDLSTTLEHNACMLFGVNQQEIREKYRNTTIFVAGQNTKQFLSTWYEMCLHPEILKNNFHYAPFHEETLVNVLLWKLKRLESLSYVYINSTIPYIEDIWNNKYEWGKEIKAWMRLPQKRGNLLVVHGEKKKEIMNKISEIVNNKKMKILFLEPHLSTGGGPAFCLKRISSLLKYYKEDVEIYVVEFNNISNDYVVQKNKIKEFVKHFYTLGENKHELIDIIKKNNINIVHVDSMVEQFIPSDVQKELFNADRTWKVVETCHDVSFKQEDKRWAPDAFAFCTPYHLKTFSAIDIKKEVIEFPIENHFIAESDKQIKEIFKQHYGMDVNKKHVLNVGLWTSWKNQAEGIEIAKKYPEMEFHFVGNQAVNFKDYWEPLMKNLPSNVKVWGERNDVENFYIACDVFMFNSTWECNPLSIREAIGYGLPIIARNLPQYEGMFDEYIQPLETDLSSIQRNYEIPSGNRVEYFAGQHFSLYNELLEQPIMNKQLKQDSIQIYEHYVDGPFIEIKGESDALFTVRFYDEKDIIQYTENIKINHWIRLDRKWFTKWRVEVYKDGELYYQHTLDLKGMRVMISFESSSLGDTIAWMPYAEEFRQKHDCQLFLSTHLNHLFKDAYPEIQFIKPGETVDNVHALYRIGWFYDKNREPVIPNTIPLQKAACNILGLEYKEIKPKIVFSPNKRKNTFEYVTIATGATMGCKQWKQEYWQQVVDYLHEEGYKVINLSREPYFLNNCEKVKDKPLDEIMNFLHHSRLFIGLGSGLSWLAWTLNKPVIMISNFSQKEHEFSCVRPVNTSVCHGCWNNQNFKFDKGDFNWCPVHKGTNRQFECNNSITPEIVISNIKNIFEGKEPTKEIEGWFSYSNLYDKFVEEASDNSTIVEIGSWFGKSTQYLVEKIEKSGKQINLEVVDTFKGSSNEEVHQEIVKKYDGDIYQQFCNNVNVDKITIHKNYSKDAVCLFNNSSIDYLMIDGDHSYEGTTEDIRNYFHKVKTGGIISGDDYNVFEGVTRAVSNFFLGAHSIIDKYNWFYRKPTIEIKHLVTVPLQERAIKSIKNFEILKKYGIEYTIIENSPYTKPIDISTYMNPSSTNVRPSHYGCYLAHTQALQEIEKDFTLILEEDAFIYTSVQEFIDILYKAIFTCQADRDIAYVSFGADIYTSVNPYNDNFDESSHQILAHCYLIPKEHKEWYVKKIKDEKWDSMDLWYNVVFQGSEKKRLFTKRVYSKQINGVSIIDGVYKDYGKEKGSY